jgi:putative ABC transport system permease protein
MQSQLRQLLDFGLIVNLIMSAVFVTLLLVTANSIAQSVRERTSDFAVLKTIGFSDVTVLGLVFLEAFVLCVVAAVAGLLVARLIFGIVSLIFGLAMPLGVALQGLALAAGLAFLSGCVPAVRTMRLDLVTALARH